MNSANLDRQKFDVVTGKKQDGELSHALPSGHALLFEGCEYYVLKLWMLYPMTYYVTRNRSEEMKYTVFAKKIETPEGIKFQNPVGAGWIANDLKNYLEIKFRFPRESIFM